MINGKECHPNSGTVARVLCLGQETETIGEETWCLVDLFPSTSSVQSCFRRSELLAF